MKDLIREFNIYKYIDDIIREGKYKIIDLCPEYVLDTFYTVFSDHVSYDLMLDTYEWVELDFNFSQFPLDEDTIKFEIERTLKI